MSNTIDHDSIPKRSTKKMLTIKVELFEGTYFAAFKGNPYPGVIANSKTLSEVLRGLSDKIKQIEKLQKETKTD